MWKSPGVFATKKQTSFDFIALIYFEKISENKVSKLQDVTLMETHLKFNGF